MNKSKIVERIMGGSAPVEAPPKPATKPTTEPRRPTTRPSTRPNPWRRKDISPDESPRPKAKSTVERLIKR